MYFKYYLVSFPCVWGGCHPPSTPTPVFVCFFCSHMCSHIFLNISSVQIQTSPCIANQSVHVRQCILVVSHCSAIHDLLRLYAHDRDILDFIFISAVGERVMRFESKFDSFWKLWFHWLYGRGEPLGTASWNYHIIVVVDYCPAE